MGLGTVLRNGAHAVLNRREKRCQSPVQFYGKLQKGAPAILDRKEERCGPPFLQAFCLLVFWCNHVAGRELTFYQKKKKKKRMTLGDCSSSGGSEQSDQLTESVVTTTQRSQHGSQGEISSCTSPNDFAACFSSQARRRIKKMVSLCTASGLLGKQ